ncbi:signal peptidase II [Luteimicrobium sp. DT211]|uniref:signal peptidase II n=1 Tax=Luteimicrobium sp. DT211 TaxID=3393412 RepID=UPI003CE99D2B
MSTPPERSESGDREPHTPAPQPEQGAGAAHAAEHAGTPRPSRRLVILLAVIAAVVLVLDQVTKAWAQHALRDGKEIDVPGGFFHLRLVYNPGAALSIATGMTWLLTIIIVVVVVFIVRSLRRLRSTGWAVALGLLLGGAVGNLLDRLLRQPGFARGYVVDFIGYGNWFVGNVADIAIVVAAVLIALLALRGIGMDGRPIADAAAPAPRHEGQSGTESGGGR